MVDIVRVLWFPLPILTPPPAPQSLIILLSMLYGRDTDTLLNSQLKGEMMATFCGSALGCYFILKYKTRSCHKISSNPLSLTTLQLQS